MGVTRSMLLAAGIATVLAGCASEKEPRLMNVRAQTSTPDEFLILPGKPLEMPQDLAQLPPPTPGALSRTDPTPEADAIAALGGNAARATRADPGLASHVTRFGVAPGIRQILAAEDLEYRRKNDGRLLERWFNVNVYFEAYDRQSLDQHAELDRWRRLGVRTPSAPPEILPEEQ